MKEILETFSIWLPFSPKLLSERADNTTFEREKTIAGSGPQPSEDLPTGPQGCLPGEHWPQRWGLFFQTRSGPFVVNVKQKQNGPTSGFLGVRSLRPAWSRLPGWHWPGEVGTSPAARPRSVSASAVTTGEASLAPARGEVCPLALPPSRAPHSGLCSDAFEVLILAENRHVFQDDLVRSARQACSMESVPPSQS